VGGVDVNSSLGHLVINSAGVTDFNGSVVAASVTTDADGSVIISNNVTTTAGSQRYFDDVILEGSVTLNSAAGGFVFGKTVNTSGLPGTVNLTLEALNGANVNFSGAIGAAGNQFGHLVVNTSGETIFGNALYATSLTTDAGGNTSIQSVIDTNGTQSFGDAVILTGDVTLSSSNNNVSFASTVSSQAGETNNLTINAGTGNISFAGAVGQGATLDLGDVVLNSSTQTLLNGDFNATSIATDSGGTTVLNGNVTTAGSQTYGDNVSIAANLALSSAAGNVTFASALNSAALEVNNLTISAANISLLGPVGTDVDAAFDHIQLNSQGLTTIDGDLVAGSLTTDIGGDNSIGANITTTGQ
jgi:hypothetical protein